VTALLTLVYAAAVAVAVVVPGAPTLAGLVVLAGLAARLTAHHRAHLRAHLRARPVVVPTSTVVPDPARAA
jgi:hypothetical protein